MTHATPGALYAHSYARDFQCDADLAEADTPEGVHDIAWQLVNRAPGMQFNTLKNVTKIVTKIIPKVQFEKEICINYIFLEFFIVTF